jgi:REP element-mobilizing transposase RayT
MTLRSRQLQLELASRSRWGGERVGAGRKPGPRRCDPHRRRAPLAARHPCHVTLKVGKDVPSLRSARLVAELERSWREACERERFRLVHYSVQNDHVHMIVEASSARDLSCGLKSIAARFARGVNRVFHRAGRVLSDRSHVHVLRTPREVRNAIAYVLLNARRHLAKSGRALPRLASIDPASSGRWFAGWRTPASPSHDPPAVAAARTWLLSMGWRRQGLIDVAEVPGRGLLSGPRGEGGSGRGQNRSFEKSTERQCTGRSSRRISWASVSALAAR